MTRARVAIVGGGPGGVNAAMLLASRGFSVDLFEKQENLGGRSGALSLGPYTFDVGSTMLMMPFVIDEMFELAGTQTDHEVEMMPIEPMYRLDFAGRSIDMFADEGKMADELRRFAPGSEAGLARFLAAERERLKYLYPVLQQSWPHLSSMARPEVVLALPHVGIASSLYDTAARYFEDEHLRLGFSFQSAYLGMSPWECPGGFGMVPYVEHAWGIRHVRGGVHRLADAMAEVARRNGARIHVQRPVRRLIVEHDHCSGVELEDGERVRADHVVIDADATHALLNLLDQDVSLRFNRKKIAAQRESCSTFMLYLGLDTVLPLAHHTFFFAQDYRAEMERVFTSGSLGDDISVYACNPAVTDGSMAPPGHSGLYLLSLVPNTRFDVNWSEQRSKLRERVLDCVERRAGLSVRAHIEVEAMLTPDDWERRFGVSHGAVFGPAHSIDQLLAFRLPNRLPHPNNVFLAGAGTSPGSGLPTILESARIAARSICDVHAVPFPASKRVPS